ncbi:CAF1-domain-containing protein [Rhizoclosmatium globosum]|uniref:CAF1-domain-containing protein n=1 Tax=Rhizoclosmatium globosum TaxID=329046 RepID=A0A1Y2CHP0_9FUNG|nr:CAF1-domain-containing protein [Rhizoclosmatium globosum]|eukprot:ORY46344.1 CAF1-domain-containing protein [Rhizoclosmatium globosum]
MSDAERERILNGEDEREAKALGELDYLLISKSDKPLIGHNMYLGEFMSTIQKFCFELPPTVGEFKSLCHSVFPVIYDTKHIANTDKKIKDLVTVSALSEMVSQLSSEPFSKPEFVMHPDFHDYLSPSATERFHEAGYDAFSTGVAFAKMMYHIADVPEGEPLDLSPTIEAQTEPVSTTRYHLNRFENKLNVMRSDEPILNLVGDEDPIDRSNVMYLANFPTSWKTHTIVSLCQPHVGHSFVADRNRVLDHVAINAIKEEPSGAGTLPLRVMLHEEFVVAEEELKAEEKAQETSRSEVEADAEDGEILDEDDGTIDVEPAQS